MVLVRLIILDYEIVYRSYTMYNQTDDVRDTTCNRQVLTKEDVPTFEHDKLVVEG